MDLIVSSLDFLLPNNMVKFFLQPGEEEKGLLGKLLDKLRALFRKKQAVAVKEESDTKEEEDEGDGEKKEDIEDEEVSKEEESKKDK